MIDKEGRLRLQLQAADPQLFEPRPMYLRLSQAHVIVPCICHFWNNNSESLRCFPVHFLDAHIQIEKQTMEERGWTLAADVREKEKVEPELECAGVVLIICLTLFILGKWNL